jgi:hypothetical protein
MAEGLSDGIDVSNRQSAEIRFLYCEQTILYLVKTEVDPSMCKIAAMMKRSSRGNPVFEAGDKLPGIALDSRLAIETQPEFGMVVFATPG